MEFTNEELRKQTSAAVEELIERSGAKPGALLVVGCSTSEIMGGVIGHYSSAETGKLVFDEIYSAVREHGMDVAAQCCEHLNRALIIERSVAEKHGWEPVCVVPQPKAGGSFATAAFASLDDPVAVERIAADIGLDIGLTLIGMHLRQVAVPLRLEHNRIGSALLTAAYTRPKYIGGSRAVYEKGDR